MITGYIHFSPYDVSDFALDLNYFPHGYETKDLQSLANLEYFNSFMLGFDDVPVDNRK